jgi:hypothetical protein
VGLVAASRGALLIPDNALRFGIKFGREIARVHELAALEGGVVTLLGFGERDAIHAC